MLFLKYSSPDTMKLEVSIDEILNLRYAVRSQLEREIRDVETCQPCLVDRCNKPHGKVIGHFRQLEADLETVYGLIKKTEEARAL